MTKTGTGFESNRGPWAQRYERCDTEDELLRALSEAINAAAAGLVVKLQPRWYGDLSWGLMRRFLPETHAERWSTHMRLVSEAIVYVSRQFREHLASSAFGDAEYVYQESALGAGGVMAARRGFDDDQAEGFHRVLSHVLVQHAHFPPEDDDAALIRLVASREEKLTVTQAVRFVTALVGSDPVRQAAPVAFVERWDSLRD